MTCLSQVSFCFLRNALLSNYDSVSYTLQSDLNTTTMPGSGDRRSSKAGSKSGGGRRGSRGSRGMSISAGGGSSAMQEQVRAAAEAAQKAKEEKSKTGRKNRNFIEVKKDMEGKRRQKEKVSCFFGRGIK